MKSNKGQALVEFVIILPVALLLIFTIVDFGRVISLKSDLDNVVSDAVTFYESGKSQDDINEIVNINYDDVILDINVRADYTEIVARKNISPITPGLSYIADKVFNVSATRVIKNE